jgi:hypothetical protein
MINNMEILKDENIMKKFKLQVKLLDRVYPIDNNDYILIGYIEEGLGYYRSLRNKKQVYEPVYVCGEKRIIDVTQRISKKSLRKI